MKGGTTVLYEFITAHPDVHSATQKEIHYFSLNYHLGVDWYESHFSTGNQLTGEASPTYFDIAWTLTIPHLIQSQLPETKLILIVRDPVERAVSHFLHLQNVNRVPELVDLDINDFFGGNLSDAIGQASERNLHLFQVLNFSCYYRKLQNYLAVFDSSRLLVLENKMLRGSPQETMARVFDFLNLSAMSSPEFAQVRYSSGKGVELLDLNVRDRLERFFHRDFELFEKLIGRVWGEGQT